MSRKRQICYFAIFTILVFALGGFWLHKKFRSRFRVETITYKLDYHPDWDFPFTVQDEEHVKAILNQPFRYLGKGGQIYAFESADGQYVLKFLKFKYLRSRISNQLISAIPLYEDWKTNEHQRRMRKVYRLYKGYKMAYEMNNENSGLVYLHFNPTFHKFNTVVLIDKLGLKHFVDLDQVFFIVQKKGKLFDELLIELLDQGNIAEASSRISGFFDMYMNQYKKGLYDLDYGALHNIGFVGERPMHIDMGRMTLDEKMKQKMNQKQDLELVIKRMEKWLNKRYPTHYAALMEGIEKKLSLLFEEEIH